MKSKEAFMLIKCHKSIGSGHLFRAASVASLLDDYQSVIFLENDCKYAQVIINSFFSQLDIEIKSLTDFRNYVHKKKPELVVLDRLDNSKAFVTSLLKTSKVISFEDLGQGSWHTNITFNEIYFKPLYQAKNIVWGPKSFLIRETFKKYKSKKFNSKPKEAIITFGGTDPRNLSFLVASLVTQRKYDHELQNIKFNIVLGPGYPFSRVPLERLSVSNRIKIFPATQDIASLMFNADFGICSNGRTVFELAHLSTPSIVIPQHAREANHDFPSENNGFIKLEYSSKQQTISDCIEAIKLMLRKDYRSKLYNNMKKISFADNHLYLKSKIYEKI